MKRGPSYDKRKKRLVAIGRKKQKEKTQCLLSFLNLFAMERFGEGMIDYKSWLIMFLIKSSLLPLLQVISVSFTRENHPNENHYEK